MLTPTELDRRPQGPVVRRRRGEHGGGRAHQRPARRGARAAAATQPARRCRPVALPMDHTPTQPSATCCHGHRRPRGPGRRRAASRRRGAGSAAALAVALVAGGGRLVVPRRARLAHGRPRVGHHDLRRRARRDRGRPPRRRCREDQFDESIPKGVVMSTDPGAGAEVRRGTDVKVTVSKGPERYAVPNIVGQVAGRGAVTSSRPASSRVGTTKEAYDEKVDSGLDPAASTPRSARRSSAAPRSTSSISKGRQPITGHRLHRQARQGRRRRAEQGRPRRSTPPSRRTATPSPRATSSRSRPPAAPSTRATRSRSWSPRARSWSRCPTSRASRRRRPSRSSRALGFKVTVERFMGGIFGTVRSQEPGRRHRAAQGQHHQAGRRLTLVSSRASRVAVLATLLLVSVTAVWGSTFFLIRDLVAHVPSADFLAVRFGIAAVVMAAVFRRQLRALTRREVGHRRRSGRALRPGPAAPDRRPRAHRRLGVGLRHRHVRRADPRARRRAAARPAPRGRPGSRWRLATAGLAVLSLRGVERRATARR